MSTPSLQAQSIQVEADPKRVLSLLSKTFSNSTTVLGELLQNARRAGATRVDVSITDSVIEFKDDGVGIEDFSVLLSVAKSGWDEALIRAESCYGAGFLATLFCCETLEVQSRGHSIKARTEDLIALKPTTVECCDDDGQTVIRLVNPTIKTHHLALEDKLSRVLCAGFPIPVHVNGQPARRAHAVDQAEFVELDIGHVSPGILTGRGTSNVYLQGLPISLHLDGFQRHGCYRDNIDQAVHLNPALFLGRMPDRNTVIDADAAVKRIRASIVAVATERLLRIASTMTPEAFVEAHADEAASLGMQDLLNAIDVVPARWLVKHSETPIRAHEYNRDTPMDRQMQGVFTRQHIASVGLFEADGEDADGNTDVLAQVYVHARNAYAGHFAPRWHWLADMEQAIAPDDIRIAAGRVLGEDMIDIVDTFTLTICESIALQLQNEDGEAVGPPVPCELAFDAAQSTIYVTPDAWPGAVVGQVDSFTDDEKFDDRAYEEAKASCELVVQSILNPEPDRLFKAMIMGQGLSFTLPKPLLGKTFTVAITEDGEVSVG